MSRKLGRTPDDPDYGLGEHTIDCDRLGLIDDQELTERLVRTFQAPDYSPPKLPTVATELLALSQNPDVGFDELESLLERDAMLAGEVLSLAQSAHFTRVRQVASVREALVRLGLEQLREIVLQAAMNLRVFRSKSYRGCMERLRLHCSAMAHLCRTVSRYTAVVEARAYLCGLLHDVGIAGILLVLGEQDRRGRPPDLAVLWPAIDAAHARAGARMVRLWNLAPEIATAVAAHHQVRVDGVDQPIAAVVCLAEAFAVQLDMALVPTVDGVTDSAESELTAAGLAAHGRVDRSDARIVELAREVLGLTESDFDRLRASVEAWAASEAIPTGG
jgi:HD-like signal output (HDOD) protein